MSASKFTGICLLALSLTLSGCVARTYNLTRDRADQDLTPASGNRGYLMGTPPPVPERKTTRTVRVVEVELGVVKKLPPRAPVVIQEQAPAEETMKVTEVEEVVPMAAGQSFEQYTVAKNDTLQKISKKFYGTTRKWKDIYEANQDILRSPDKLYPGQSLKIPVKMAEPQENLK